MLHKLPLEIVQLILERIHGTGDLKRLCEVSKHIYNYTVPRLYQAITLRVGEEWELEDFDVEALLRTCSTANNLLRNVKHLHLAADFHKRLDFRCVHNDSRYPALEELEEELVPLFDRLSDNSLYSFSWDLGTCLPDAVLAFLSKKQTCLGSLSLVTDGSCLGLESQDTYLSLVLLTRLRHLSWRALQSVEEFDALAKILQGNVEHLEELELDLLDWVGANEQLRNGRANRSRNRFARDVLKLEAGKRRVLFPRLSSLSLSAVSFRRSIKDMASAFNFDRLQTLKLRNCPGTNALLEMLVDSHPTIRLTSLELVVRSDDPESSSSTPAACRFLEMFDGLKDLFMLVHGPERTTNKYWDAVLHHKPTLKRVVYHEREVDIDDECPNFDLFTDNMLSWDGSMFDLFRRGNLEYVGLCDSSVYLAPVLSVITPRPKYRLLHIRRTGVMPSTYGLPRNEGSSSDESSSEDANSEELSSDEQDNHTIDGESSDNDDPSIISPSGLVLTDGARPGECGCVMSNNESTSSDHDLSRVGDIVKNIFDEFLSTDIKQKARALFPEILPEELAFAQWAFGSDGLTALQVLAFGDFSFRGRFPDQQVLLSRMEQQTSGRDNDRLSQSTDVSQLTFRRVKNDDTCLQALVDAQCDLLEACPVDSLLRPL